VGHLQVVIGFLDQLYMDAWSVLGESGGVVLRSHYTNGYHGPHIGPKHVVVVTLLVIREANIVI